MSPYAAPHVPQWREVENYAGEPIARVSTTNHMIVQIRARCGSTSCKAGVAWLSFHDNGARVRWFCDEDCYKSWKAQRAAAKYEAAKKRVAK